MMMCDGEIRPQGPSWLGRDVIRWVGRPPLDHRVRGTELGAHGAKLARGNGRV